MITPPAVKEGNGLKTSFKSKFGLLLELSETLI